MLATSHFNGPDGPTDQHGRCASQKHATDVRERSQQAHKDPAGNEVPRAHEYERSEPVIFIIGPKRVAVDFRSIRSSPDLSCHTRSPSTLSCSAEAACTLARRHAPATRTSSWRPPHFRRVTPTSAALALKPRPLPLTSPWRPKR